MPSAARLKWQRRREKVLARLDRMLGSPWLRWHFRQKVGYWPHLRHPRSHNEKIQARKLYDRNPLFPMLSDKIAVRDHVRNVLGEERAEQVLLPLLGQTGRPTEAWLRALGRGVVVKANHGSGWNELIRDDGSAVNYWLLARKLQGWCQRRYGQRNQEWAYWSIRPRILAEPMLCYPNGRAADDFKFSVNGGRATTVQVQRDRFGNHEQAYFDRDWNRLPMQMEKLPAMPDTPPAPAQLAEMIVVAEAVAAMLDYARVDFLVTDTRFVLNEITLYRSSGFNAFIPEEWDFIWGAQWPMQMVRPKGWFRRWWS
ncbi:ATP-grasp fold amidoligase family protein [Neogemmobacter tilapiae]|uniref:Uncharacterized protein n=1 Tax=Neogemmobacter tilapiae TaxID=875041 RepID=A0A918TMX9_9RHOB|nr:ATP-grasp fold amidoligase family protein [Gemmobacter tilapiae]GHC54015.1 hypothetical protein GCM10007315_16020 [Gemmobacter tilapiae]